MPTFLFINGFRFYVYLNEHEPIHVHVKKGDSKAKIILVPEILIDKNHGFKLQEMKNIIEIIEENYFYLIDKWNETFYS
jgi:hypothetical protein